jgi:NarL family two-component system response regulator LiaR
MTIQQDAHTLHPKVRILIVDDHNIVRRGLRVSLEDFDDIEVVGDTGDAREVADLCAKLNPHVVLMDIVMPRMDGITTTLTIGERFPAIKVVILTSFADEEDIQRVLKAGAISYLQKDVTSEELVAAIRKAAQGQGMLSSEATRILIQAATRPPQIGHDLTDREHEVLALMIEGLNNREIAERLVISSSTVKNHVSNILDKLGTSSRTQAVALAVENRLI